MTTPTIDQDALVKMFAEATSRQGETLRKAVGDATLKALQGRELTLTNIGKAVTNVASAASTGAAQNQGNPVDVQALLGKALAGMDGALLQTVEANRRALQQFIDQGNGLQAPPLQSAMANIEKMEDTFFAAITKAAQGAGPMQGPWTQALDSMRQNGTQTGPQATQTVEALMAQTQGMLRESRAATTKAAQAMLDGYAAMVSGVLLGMSEGLRSAGVAPKGEAPAAASPPTSN